MSTRSPQPGVLDDPAAPDAADSTFLRVDEVTVRFGGLTALDNLDAKTLGTRPSLSHVTARLEIEATAVVPT